MKSKLNKTPKKKLFLNKICFKMSMFIYIQRAAFAVCKLKIATKDREIKNGSKNDR